MSFPYSPDIALPTRYCPGEYFGDKPIKGPPIDLWGFGILCVQAFTKRSLLDGDGPATNTEYIWYRLYKVVDVSNIFTLIHRFLHSAIVPVTDHIPVND